LDFDFVGIVTNIARWITTLAFVYSISMVYRFQASRSLNTGKLRRGIYVLFAYLVVITAIEAYPVSTDFQLLALWISAAACFPLGVAYLASSIEEYP
jgi:hypothetical protein